MHDGFVSLRLFIFVVAALTLCGCGDDPARRISYDDVAAFLNKASKQEGYVGSGLLEDNTLLSVTVTHNAFQFDRLALDHLPAGTRYEIHAVPNGLAELEALAARIMERERANPDLTFIDVDEVQGLVVVGVSAPSETIAKQFKERYGPLVVLEGQSRAVPF